MLPVAPAWDVAALDLQKKCCTPKLKIEHCGAIHGCNLKLFCINHKYTKSTLQVLFDRSLFAAWQCEMHRTNNVGRLNVITCWTDSLQGGNLSPASGDVGLFEGSQS